MRNPGGYNVIVAPGERAIEHDVTKCVHCQFQMMTRPKPNGGPPQMMVFANDGTSFRWADMGFCRNCWGSICVRKACQDNCKHWEAQLEIEEAADRRIRSQVIESLHEAAERQKRFICE